MTNTNRTRGQLQTIECGKCDWTFDALEWENAVLVKDFHWLREHDTSGDGR